MFISNTMKLLIVFLFSFFALGQVFAQSDTLIVVQTQKNELVYTVGKNQKVFQVYLGEKLKTSSELTTIRNSQHEMYIPFGTSDLFESAIRTTHNDGNIPIRQLYLQPKLIR